MSDPTVSSSTIGRRVPAGIVTVCVTTRADVASARPAVFVPDAATALRDCGVRASGDPGAAFVAQASKETEASSGQTLQTASQLSTLSRELLRLVQPDASASLLRPRA